MGKIKEKLNELFMDAVYEHDHIHVCIDKAIDLFTPKLQWKQEAERVWRGATPFRYTFTIFLHPDGYWEVVKADEPKFQGTIDNCKKECERIFMEMYLTTCNNE